MEQKNIITLTGRIGQIKFNTFGDRLSARISMATTREYINNNGEKLLETYWHEVEIWEHKHITKENIESLTVGLRISVTGRGRNMKYTTANGTERSLFIVSANKVSVMDQHSGKTECKAEIAGRVGNIKVSEVGDTLIANFSVATEHIYHDRNGGLVSEVTWHHINLFSGKKHPKELVQKIKKGTAVTLSGYIKYNVFQDSNENTVKVPHIYATEFDVLQA